MCDRQKTFKIWILRICNYTGNPYAWWLCFNDVFLTCRQKVLGHRTRADLAESFEHASHFLSSTLRSCRNYILCVSPVSVSATIKKGVLRDVCEVYNDPALKKVKSQFENHHEGFLAIQYFGTLAFKRFRK